MSRGRTFFSQATAVLPLPGRPGQYVMLADRWVPTDLGKSRRAPLCYPGCTGAMTSALPGWRMKWLQASKLFTACGHFLCANTTSLLIVLCHLHCPAPGMGGVMLEVWSERARMAVLRNVRCAEMSPVGGTKAIQDAE